jgi:hypothetical protein
MLVRPATTGSRGGVLALACVVALLALHLRPASGGPGDPRPSDTALDQRFQAVVKAWVAKDHEAVVALIDPAERATVHLTLLDEPAVQGSFGRAQAKQTLKTYFGRLRGTPRLVDVTTAESKRDVPRARILDYTYRREGVDPVTTRLEIVLEQVGTSWILASVVERPRPRTPAPPALAPR